MDGGEVRAVTSLRLYESTLAKLDEIGRRLGGQSRGMVVEVLVGLYGDQIGPDTPIPAKFLMSSRRTNQHTVNSQAKRRKK